MRHQFCPKLFIVLQIVVKTLENTDIKWVLAGSTSLALQGVELEPGDIDILTNREGAYRIVDLLKKHQTIPVKFRSNKWSRSYFGELEINRVKIEVMGDLEEKIGGKWVSLSGRLVSPKLLNINSMKVPVSSLEEQLKSYRLSSRKPDKIRSQKIQETLKNRRHVQSPP